MYINRTLLLLLAFGIVFAPTAQEWIVSGGEAWYRPYLIWLLIIVLAWWNSRSDFRDDL